MGRVIVPPDEVVRVMRERAERLFDGFGRATGEEVFRAMLEAWTEGVNAGFNTDDCMRDLGLDRDKAIAIRHLLSIRRKP